ncbi:MAG: glycosyltransferase family 39 protein, partial [Candidatus Aureabacteria bacterium]|nr:glycosyltransferase family 39 protein [Candidatus Auribacterota bacterium]
TALSIISSLDGSPTFDEGVHLATGFAYLKWPGAQVYDPSNPSFSNALAALPLFFLRLDPLFDRCAPPGFSLSQNLGFIYWLSQKLFYQTKPGADPILLICRLPMILLSALFGLTVFVWARRLWGDGAGLAALFLFVFSPEMLAHGRLITNDAGGAFFMFLSIFLFWNALKSGKLPPLVFSGLAAGAAAATKYAAISLVPILAVTGAVFIAGEREGEGKWGKWRGFLLRYLLWMGAAFLIVTAVYRVRDLPLFWQGIVQTFGHYQGWRPSFLLGRYSGIGWRYYFLVTFLLKTPPAFFPLLAAALIFRRRLPRTDWRDGFFLLFPALAYFLAASFSRLAIGNRHILFVYAPLFVFAARSAAVIPPGAKGKALHVLTVLLFLWYAASALSVYPHVLAYISELAGGPKNAANLVSDSNIDWGQDLKRLKIAMDRRGIRGVILSYFGEADPRYYGINYQYLFSDGPLIYREFKTPPDKKYLAISLKCLQGVSFDDHDLFSWLQDYPPVEMIGYSIYLYDLTGKIDAYLRLAYIYAVTGRPRLAEKELREVLAIEPDNPVALRGIRQWEPPRSPEMGRR